MPLIHFFFNLLKNLPMDSSIFSVVDLDEFTESATVVVHNGLGVAKCLKNEK